MDRISRIFSGGRVPHSFLITGEEGAEKEAFALRLARALICEGEHPPCGVCAACRKAEHPDLIHALQPAVMDAAKNKIGVVRDMIADTHILPNDGHRKVYVVQDASRLTVDQQNVLLATIEEPPKHVCFIFTVNHASDLLPTVVSRCTQIKLSGHGVDLACIDQARSILLPLSKRDELGVLSACMALEKCDRAELRDILESCRTLLRDGALRTLPPLISGEPAPVFTYAEFVSCCDAIDRAADGIIRNLGVAIILGGLCARLTCAISAEEEQ
ncbi:MAG: hypothetical protein IJC88_04660 [Oscillospiraceae bacterium]|nr:hypothetical protein [Oscillospiraceae bacterium]